MEGGMVGGEVSVLGPDGERKRWRVVFVNAVEEGGGEGAKATKVVNSKRKEIKTMCV